MARKENASSSVPDPRVTGLHARRLQEALEQIPDLRKLTNGAWNPAFETWQQRVSQSLGTIFGAKHGYVQQFTRLRFCVPQFRPEGGGWSGADHREFENDLTVSEQVLKDALEEVDYAPAQQDVPAPVPGRAGPPIVVNVMNVLSQATNVSVSQILTSTQFMSLPADVREQAAVHAKDLEKEIRGQQRWPILAKSLEALKSLGKGAYEHVALPLILDMLKKQTGLSDST